MFGFIISTQSLSTKKIEKIRIRRCERRFLSSDILRPIKFDANFGHNYLCRRALSRCASRGQIFRPGVRALSLHIITRRRPVIFCVRKEAIVFTRLCSKQRLTSLDSLKLLLFLDPPSFYGSFLKKLCICTPQNVLCAVPGRLRRLKHGQNARLF